MSYRQSHAAQGYGKRYEEHYGRGYYAAQWALIERPLLVEALSSASGPDRSCLDFACGTGRITRALASEFGRVVGVDVSAAMLSQARVPDNVQLIETDLTRQTLPERFDAATAFRFFLNAEPALRREALAAIRRQLKPGAPLVCNIHMSATSPMGYVYRSIRAVSGRNVHQVLSRQDFLVLLADAGFTVDRVVAYSYLPRPGHFLGWLSEKALLPFERLASTLRVPERFAQSFLVVARRGTDA